jgi:hypothetical protein
VKIDRKDTSFNSFFETDDSIHLEVVDEVSLGWTVEEIKAAKEAVILHMPPRHLMTETYRGVAQMWRTELPLRHELWKRVQPFLLKSWIKKIRALKVWNDEARNAYIDVIPQEDWNTAGLYHREIGGPSVLTIYCTGDLVEDLGSILHEMAHAHRNWRDHHRCHSPQWAKVFCEATVELTNGFCKLDEERRGSGEPWSEENAQGYVQDAYVTDCLNRFFKR